MEPLAVIADSNLVEQSATYDFSLDMEAGPKYDNVFELSLPLEFKLYAGYVFHVDGTEIGGIITGRLTDTEAMGLVIWKGRTWHGMLEDKCLQPDDGQDYNYARGSVSECIDDLLQRINLVDMFEVGECPDVTVNYRYPRYPNGYVALVGMLKSVGLCPTFSTKREGGIVRVAIGAEAKKTLENVADGDLVDFTMDAVLRPYNHIVALGQGELSERYVLQYWTDEQGNIHEDGPQITGRDERTIIYDGSSMDNDELMENAIKQLLEAQDASSVEVSLDDVSNVNIGDELVAYDQRIDAREVVPVSGYVAKIGNGVQTVEWAAGNK